MTLIKENAPTCQDNMTTQQHGILHKESNFIKVQGQVTFDMRDAVTGEVIEQRVHKNIVTVDMSILLARLCVNNGEPDHGIKYLAMGTGDVAWDLQSPPPATNAQIALETELARKPFHQVDFIDDLGVVSPTPTNIVDFTATFAASEAVGPLVELGLIGGDALPDASNNRQSSADAIVDNATLCTYLTFAVINKPSSAVLTITYRLTF